MPNRTKTKYRYQQGDALTRMPTDYVTMFASREKQPVAALYMLRRDSYSPKFLVMGDHVVLFRCGNAEIEFRQIGEFIEEHGDHLIYGRRLREKRRPKGPAGVLTAKHLPSPARKKRQFEEG